MGVLRTLIDDITVGTDKTLARTLIGVPSGFLLLQAWFTVKDNPTRTDAEAVLQKIITSGLSLAGQITDTGTSGVGAMQFELYPTDTLLLTPGQIWLFDIRIKLNSGRVYPGEEGVILTRDRITRATS
jgi:hypothetical protein